MALPLVLPPTVLGFYLLVAMGPMSPVGRAWIAVFGRPLAFSFEGLLVASILYALPFAVQPFAASLSAVDPRLVEASYTLGRLAARHLLPGEPPARAPGVVAGAVLTFAHALGEFGVVLMVGGNIAGRDPHALHRHLRLGGAARLRHGGADRALPPRGLVRRPRRHLLAPATSGDRMSGTLVARRRPGVPGRPGHPGPPRGRAGARRGARALRAVRLRQDDGPSGLAGLERPDARARAVRRGDLVRRRGGGSTCPRSGVASASCSRSYALFPHLTVEGEPGLRARPAPPRRAGRTRRRDGTAARHHRPARPAPGAAVRRTEAARGAGPRARAAPAAAPARRAALRARRPDTRGAARGAAGPAPPRWGFPRWW